MLAKQLVLPFEFTSEKATSKISDRAKNFVVDSPELDLPLSNKYKLMANEENLIELCFAQYAKAYHTKYRAGTAVAHYPQALADFRSSVGYGSVKSLVGLNLGNTENAHTPAYFRLEYVPRSKRIHCDYAFSVYTRQANRPGSIDRTKPLFRSWVHVEYTHFKHEKRHVVDPARSWVASCSDVYQTGYYAQIFKSIPNYHNDMLMTFPWMQLSSYDISGIGEWYNTLLKNIKEFLTKNFVVMPDGDYWTKTNFRNNGLSPAPSFVGLTVHTKYLKDMVDKLVDGVSDKIYPSFYRFALNFIKRFPIQEAYAYGSNNYKTCQDMLKHVLKLLAHYDDATFLTYIDLEQLYNSTIDRGYGYNTQALVSVDNLLNDSLFKKFPRSKQYKLLAELFAHDAAKPRTYNAGMKPRDLMNMLAKIHNVKPEPGEPSGFDATEQAVDTRDIKTLDDYHDKIVPVFNKIQYKPVDIPAKHYEWLTSYGLEIPETVVKLVIPETNNTVREWGTTQGHCIGSYANNAVNGTTLLLGVMDRETGKWIGHIQCAPPGSRHVYRVGAGAPARVRTISVQQFYGKHNSAVDTQIRNVVNKHMNEALVEFDRSKDEKETEVKEESKKQLEKVMV